MTNISRDDQNGKGSRPSFVIGNYIDFLQPAQKKGNYICPVCSEGKLWIEPKNKEGYQCYGCGESNKIAYILREQNGEFNKPKDHKSSNSSISRISSSSVKQVNSIDVFTPEKLSNRKEIINFLRDEFNGRLAYNSRIKEIELDDRVLTIDTFSAWIADKYNKEIALDKLCECTLYLAQQNQYDPVKRYLERCKNNAEIMTIDWIGELLGCQDKLYNIYIQKWLIGAVARVYEPGCKFDEVLILQGAQGLGKSSFFRILAGDFFCDSMTGELGKDDLLNLHSSWICEWAELDGFTAKTYHGKIKHFLSRQDDMFREPYGRKSNRYPRSSVIVGTTNREDFLTDPTGNRRFWIVPCKGEIDLENLENLKTSIWASAIDAYEKGESWQLPRELWADQADDNKQYVLEDPWIAILEQYLDDQDGLDVTSEELFDRLESKSVTIVRSKSDQMRLADLMRNLGWAKARVSRGNHRITIWRKM